MTDESKYICGDRVPLKYFDEFEARSRAGYSEQSELTQAAQRREDFDAQRRIRQVIREQSMNEFRTKFARWLTPGVDKLKEYMTHK